MKVLFALATTLLLASPLTAATKPNIVLIFIDDMARPV